MVKKIKANKFHISKICKEARLEALMIKVKEEFDRLDIPKGIINFDNDLADLVIKHLMKIPIEELESFYGDRALLDLIKDTIELEKKYPGPSPLEKLPSCYI